MPELRVIASFYNCEAEVAPGLDTVKAQTLTDYECVIVDDCSRDGTARAIEAWLERSGDARFRFAPNTRNRGIAWVRSHHSRDIDATYLAFQEAGDQSSPGRYRASVEKMTSDARYGMVGCRFRNVVSRTGRAYVRGVASEDDLTFERLLAGNRFAGGELFFRSAALASVGGIVDDLPFCEDYLASLRIARRYKIGHIPEVLYTRSVDFKGLSFRADAFVTQCMCVLAARDMARDGTADPRAYLQARGGLESYKRDGRLRRLLVRGALRSLYLTDWGGGLAIAAAAVRATAPTGSAARG